MTGTCSVLDARIDTPVFEGHKRAQNDGFGSKTYSRKSSEVILRLECVGHLPRCCGRANAGPGVFHRDNITLGHPENTHVGSVGPLEASQCSRGQTKPDNGRNESCVYWSRFEASR